MGSFVSKGGDEDKGGALIGKGVEVVVEGMKGLGILGRLCFRGRGESFCSPLEGL